MRIATLFAACLAASAAGAGELAEMHGESLDLGTFRGVVYYTSNGGMYQVVATLAADANGTPVRFVATLGEGQEIEISVPGALGEAGRFLKMTRTAGKLLVSDGGNAPRQLVSVDD
jgi:hypothetical protein